MHDLSRRTMLAGAAALTPALAPALARAADIKAALGTPPSVISNPPRDFGPHAPPLSNPDPDVLVLDRSFGGMLVGQAMIHRIHTGLIRQRITQAWNRACTIAKRPEKRRLGFAAASWRDE